MGCGTGILAILAAMKNAQSVDAIDIDEWAYNNAIENVKKNIVAHKVTVQQGDATLLKDRTYNLILANINRNILLQDMAAYASSLAANGILVVSGIFTEDTPAITEKATTQGLQRVEEKNRNRWVRVVFRK
jgi:ribosomal protein L11 methyltransferase